MFDPAGAFLVIPEWLPGVNSWKLKKKTMDPPKWMGLCDAGDLDLVCFAGSHILRNGKGKVQVAHWIQEDNFPVQR